MFEETGTLVVETLPGIIVTHAEVPRTYYGWPVAIRNQTPRNPESYWLWTRSPVNAAWSHQALLEVENTSQKIALRIWGRPGRHFVDAEAEYPGMRVYRASVGVGGTYKNLDEAKRAAETLGNWLLKHRSPDEQQPTLLTGHPVWNPSELRKTFGPLTRKPS